MAKHIRAVLNEFRTFAHDGARVEEILEKLIDEMEDILNNKGRDYSSIFPNDWGNLELAAHYAQKNPQTIFATMIAIKMGRAINLSYNWTAPQYESLQDTWSDLLNYIILWLAYQRWYDEIHSDSAD